MKVLIVGGGAREHAIAWKLRRDRPEVELILAPGNHGSAKLGRAVPVAAADVPGLAQLAESERVDLTICGPEVPLAAGIADRFQELDMAIFGPTQRAAEIEWSKGWAKAFMGRHGIPTARFEAFESLTEAERYIRAQRQPPVVKDDALAGGKGVTVAASADEALAAVREIFRRPGARVVIEERMLGFEVSAHAFCDGRTARLMPFSCDYKRVGDGDTGPNTGGMGAYAPARLPDELRRRVQDEIVEPALAGLASEGRPFTGVLYPGLMVTDEGPKVVEFNGRFGDPETEALLPLLESDLLEIVQACIEGRLDTVQPRWSSGYCCAVVIASPGYPESPQPAEASGLESTAPAIPFVGGRSGRMVTVSATGATLDEARQQAYSGVRRITVPGGHFRTDVAAVDRAAGAYPGAPV